MRNCGFTWEPGPFSIFLVLGIYFNFLRSHSKFIFSTRNIILIIALFTTQSTTGFLAFFPLLLNIQFTYKKGLSKYFIGFVFLLFIIFLFFELDFLYYKIDALYRSGNDADLLIENAMKHGGRASLGRFAGFTIGFSDFLNYPILGYAGANGRSVLSNLNVNLNMVSGLASILGVYGLFGILILSFYLKKSSKYINNLYVSNMPYAILYILIIGLIAFHVQIMVMLFVIMFYSMFSQTEKSVKTANLK